METICRFIPATKTSENIHIINFVYEAFPQNVSNNGPNPVYRIFYVVSGTGEVSCDGNYQTVNEGDVFFNFPAVSYEISSGENFQYMYISFVGIRANAELERLGINSKNFVFKNFNDLADLWLESIRDKNEIIDLTAEGVLLYTLAKIGTRTLYKEKETSQNVSIINYSLLKKYIDDNFADPDLSLEKLSAHFSYTKKYISTLFKKHFKIRFAEYINIIRINHACRLVEEGYTNVTLIAEESGFSDALYFSKVFKQKVGMSPKKYILENEMKQKNE